MGWRRLGKLFRIVVEAARPSGWSQGIIHSIESPQCLCPHGRSRGYKPDLVGICCVILSERTVRYAQFVALCILTLVTGANNGLPHP